MCSTLSRHLVFGKPWPWIEQQNMGNVKKKAISYIVHPNLQKWLRIYELEQSCDTFRRRHRKSPKSIIEIILYAKHLTFGVLLKAISESTRPPWETSLDEEGRDVIKCWCVVSTSDDARRNLVLYATCLDRDMISPYLHFSNQEVLGWGLFGKPRPPKTNT